MRLSISIIIDLWFFFLISFSLENGALFRLMCQSATGAQGAWHGAVVPSP